MQTLLRLNRYFIVGFILVMLGLSYFLTQLNFQYNIDRFFPANNKHLTFLKKFQERLEPDDNFLLVGVEHQKNVFDSSFLGSVHEFGDSLERLPAVQRVTDLTRIKEPVKGPFGFLSVPLIHLDQPERYSSDSAQIYKDPRWPNYLISDDAEALAMLVKTQPELPQDSADRFIQHTKELVKDYDFHDTRYAGRTISQVNFVKKIKQEVIFYVVACNIVLLIILYLIFRRPLGVLVPMMTVVFGMVLFFELLGLLNVPLDIMSTLYPTLMLIIGMSDVIHIMSKYVDELRKGVPRIPAMHTTIREIGFATLLTSLTTAVGFLALLTSQIPPLKTFGIFAAVGVFMAYLTVIAFTTMVLVNFDADQLSKPQAAGQQGGGLLGRIFGWVSRHQRAVWAGSLLALIVFGFGLSQISRNMFMLTSVPEESQIRQDFRFFENKFSGVRPIEIAILPQGNYDINDPAVIREVRKFEEHLTSYEPINHVVSPLTIYRTANKSLSNGKLSAYHIPEDSSQFRKINQLLKQRGDGTFAAVMGSQQEMGRITGKMKDIGSENVKALYSKIRDYKADNINTSITDFRITGKMFLVDKNNDYLIGNLITGLALAFVVVGILMGLLFRQLKMVLISFIPNIIPLIIAGAVMGYFDITLKATTSIIFTIAFGIAVDDTIHFLSRFKLEQLKGASQVMAMRRTFVETGKAISFTTIILLSGFSTLIFSDFTVTYYIGLLIGLTLASALIADLLLMPLLLYRFYR